MTTNQAIIMKTLDHFVLYSIQILCPACIAMFALLTAERTAQAQNVGDWQTVPGLASGYWINDSVNSAGTSSTWQEWNGTAWTNVTADKIAGISYPSNNVNNVITILPGTSITNSSAGSGPLIADEITVSSGADLSIQKTNFTLGHSTYTTYDLDVFGGFGLACSTAFSFALSNNATIAIENGGAMTNYCGTSSDNFTNTPGGSPYTSSEIQFLNGSLYVQLGSKASFIPQATWHTGSTVIFEPPVTGNWVPKGFPGQTYYNFIWNWPLQAGNDSGMSGNTTINGNFIIMNSANAGWAVEDVPDGGFTLNVGGNIAITNGLWYPVSSTAGTGIVNVGGNFIVDSTAGIKVNKSASLCDVVFDGSSPQALAIYGTNSSLGYWNWTVNNGSTVNLQTNLFFNSPTNQIGGGNLTNNGVFVFSPGTMIIGCVNIVLGPGSTYNVSQASAYTLASNQALSGAGTVTGGVAVASGATLHPGGGHTLTFKNNLTFNSGSTNIFDLGSSTSSGDDQIVLNGTGGTLTCGGAQIIINSAGTLAAANYTLFNVSGASGSISGSFNATPLWMGTTPANAANYSIATSGTQVLLKYASASSGPAITNLVLSGSNLLLNGTNGAAATYRLFTSTNVALPLIQWTPVATNTLSASGNFSMTCTNVVNPSDKQQFYILRTP